MAVIPWFVFSPSSIIGIIGLMTGRRKRDLISSPEGREAVVDIVIPALNEERNIVLCLSSIARQTLQPRFIILVDDGSTDRTTEFAKKFCELNSMKLIAIKRRKPQGKTPTLRRQANELDSDVEFVLDADTVLESENYLERVVQELYRHPGIASVCGAVAPLRERDRSAVLHAESVQQFVREVPDAPISLPGSALKRFKRGLTNIFRATLYRFLQQFIYPGQIALFGSIINPVGCAVAYRRSYLKQLFDAYQPVFGDNLTNSEDIFIGFALLNAGYSNVQVRDVYARSEEPEVTRLPRQFYLWSSAFLQSCYYFDPLLRSLFSMKKRSSIKDQLSQPVSAGASEAACDRPVGWLVFTAAFEKGFFPLVLSLMILLQLWEPLIVTVFAEITVTAVILAVISRGDRINAVVLGLLSSPIRYAAVFYDIVTFFRFGKDLWVSENRKWRK